VAWLSIAGAAVCLAGAWLIRHARIVDEREAARAQIGAGPLISSQISR
jgi:hypothetical protein